MLITAIDETKFSEKIVVDQKHDLAARCSEVCCSDVGDEFDEVNNSLLE
jgi:hypothetical protein